jgi:anti-anti-sigma regulatory factor
MGASGILDASTAPALVCVVEGHLSSGRRFLRLNVSRLRVGDAEGLGALVEAHRRVLPRAAR